MKEDFDEHSYCAGYPGHDSMREKARKLMAEEMKGTKMTMPGSFSEPSREKMRLYKKGGPVKHHKHYRHEDKEEKRSHLHHLQKEGLHETERALKKESHLKRGGHVRKHRHHHADGGQTKLFPMHKHEESGMKRSLHHHHPETRDHKTRYGTSSGPKDIQGGSLTNLKIPTPKLNVESVKGAERMRKGGDMHRHHHKKHHHVVKKAAGGTVYERDMLGEHPSKHLKKINYEKDMKGMHPSRVPPMTGSHRKNPHALDESFGTTFKRGGHCKSKKFAIGGVGKMRKGVADKSGRPKMAKRKMGY